ncbi:MAG: hypothetical protein ACSLEM_04015 [Candidatus Malihini olakiniferum]
MGYLFVLTEYTRRFTDVAKTLPGSGLIFLQATVADFMKQSHFTRHIRKMRLHAARRGYLVDALRHLVNALAKHLALASSYYRLREAHICWYYRINNEQSTNK